ncbi:hypothetical protein [Pseudanabaena sp. ABRG5-3]|uniref:hypothetical protein n=1 Tax=Pseudanabaena sp. ABRG5-3 TaxID=685565 RepID=UPI000F8190B1|nr:hypothetical protein [Pseudanabaena sp. ABRG5-3]
MKKANFIVTSIGAIAFLGSLLGSCTPDAPDKTATSASPTTTSTATKSPDAKSVVTKPDAAPKSDARIIKVKIDGLETYKHPSGLFQIDAPKGWTPKENKKPNEVIVLWFDPSKNALLTVDVFKAPSETTPEQLTSLLETFLKSTFGSRPGFAAEKPIQQKDGSVQIVWSYDESLKNITAKVQGNSFISRNGDKISLITTGGVADQIPALKDSFDRIVNSYKVDPAVAIP